MLLSIIIPVYNTCNFLEKCIRSCEQEFIDDIYEIIVINDGSSDGSLNKILSLALEYANIKIINQENKGLSSARNVGLKVAIGDYIWFVDSDDWVNPNSLSIIYNNIYGKKVDCFVFRSVEVYGNNVIHKADDYSKYSNQIISGKEFIRCRHSVCATAVIWNKEFLKSNNLKFVNGIFHEDLEFTPRAYYLAKNILIVDDVLYYVRRSANSITQSVNDKKSYDLVETVAYNLVSFVEKNVDVNDRGIYYNIISTCINNSLYNILRCDNTRQRKFSIFLTKKRNIYKYMIKSKRLVDKVEGVLFMMFPAKSITLYKLSLVARKMINNFV